MLETKSFAFKERFVSFLFPYVIFYLLSYFIFISCGPTIFHCRHYFNDHIKSILFNFKVDPRNRGGQEHVSVGFNFYNVIFQKK